MDSVGRHALRLSTLSTAQGARICSLNPDQSCPTILDTFRTDWVVKGRDPDNNLQMEEAATRFLDEVERDINDLLVFIPIDGLKGSYPDGLQLGRCQLYHNSTHSEFRRLLQELGIPDIISAALPR